MRMLSRTAHLIFLVLIFIGCYHDSGSSPGGIQDPDLETVVGVVTAIDDQVPVDGGVTIELRLDDGSQTQLLFASMFTEPPPTEEQVALYRVIQQIEIGQRVTASGFRSEVGIRLESLLIHSR